MMEPNNIFDAWGGIRSMARDLGRAPSTVHGWKKEGRIPATEQARILRIAQSLNLGVTVEHVVFPLGRPERLFPLIHGKAA